MTLTRTSSKSNFNCSIRFFQVSGIYNKQVNNMTTINSLEAQIELKYYFSTYLSDAIAAVNNIKHLVYDLISIELPQPPPTSVQPDILSIMVACQTCYDDLRRIENILRGHVKARKNKKSTSQRQSRVSQRKFAHFDNCSDSSATPIINEREDYFKEEDSFKANELAEAIANSKLQSRATMVTQLSESELKQKKHVRTEGNEEKPFEKDQDMRICFADPSSSFTERTEGRVKSVQMMKRIQNLKESRASQLVLFEKSNKECVSLIEQMKTQLKAKQAKNPHKLRKR